MIGDLAAALDALDLAVARSAGVLGDDELAGPARAVRAARARRGHLGGTLVIAIAGGTGSGKSSVLNALAGAAVASVSHLRPHTDRALAWYPEDAEPALAGLFDEYGIEERVAHDRLPGVALVDLPDHDSVVGAHRATVEALLPRVDGVLWVLDPQKYRDRALHDDYLAPLADYQDQFLFVLNQADRVGDAAGDVAEDARAALRASGIAAPQLFVTAADPLHGPPAGIDGLRAHLAEQLDAKQLALGKLLADVRRAGEELAARAGVTGGGSLDFERRWSDVRDQAAATLAAGGTAAEHDTSCRLADFVAALSVEAGGTFGRELRGAFPLKWLEGQVDAVHERWRWQPAAGDAAGAPRRRFRSRRRRRPEAAAAPPVAELAAGLDAGIGDALRDRLYDRALLGATLAAFRVELATAESRLGAHPERLVAG